VTGTPEEIAARLRLFADTGYSSVEAWLHPGTIEGVEAFAPVVEMLRGDRVIG
jgi:hypothetical protein